MQRPHEPRGQRTLTGQTQIAPTSLFVRLRPIYIRAMLHRSFGYKLAPTADQEILMRRFAGVVRVVYNVAYQQRHEWWRQYRRNTGKRISFAGQCKELTELRAEFDWIASVPVRPQQQALRDLDKAYANFFTGRSGYPKPRKKSGCSAFRFPSCDISLRSINAKWSAVRIPGIGWVKFRDTRALNGKLLSATVSLKPSGWHVSFMSEEERDVIPSSLPAVGIDRGVAQTLSLSTGEHLNLPSRLSGLERSIRKAQRQASRLKRGSARHQKAQRRVAKLHGRASRIRRDWHHKASTNIAARFGTVVLEDLATAQMARSAKGTSSKPGKNVRQKAGLNRAIMSQGWFSFELMLAYKLEERGGHLIKVDPRHTSQTCSECGVVDRESRENQASFSCRHCGHQANADHNAAINILRRWSTPLLGVEASGCAAGEASTIEAAA